MKNNNEGGDHGNYWFTWSLLLLLGLGMVGVSSVSLPRIFLVPLLILGMFLMAWLITFRFMHLHDEKMSLVVMVVGATLFTAVALFILIIPDGIRILTLLPR